MSLLPSQPQAPEPPPRVDFLFQNLLESIPAGAYTCDAEGLITCFNKQAEAVWGRKPTLNSASDRFCGSFKLFQPDGSPMAHKDCWMARALNLDREFLGCEVIIEKNTGERVHGLAHVSPLHDSGGKLIGAINIIVDISGQKKLEEQLLRMDRAKTEFLATLAHELRNPLAPIKNALELLTASDDPDRKQTWAIDVIRRQTAHLSRLIDDLLELSRINTNKLDIRFEKVCPNEVIQAAVEISQPAIRSCGHHLTVKAPDDPIHVEGDHVRLVQVFSNLLSNAVKFTRPGGKINIQAGTHGGHAVVVLRDNGTGIPPNLLPNVFDMFLQGRTTGYMPSAGLGIGLTLAQRMVQVHGGTISVFSEGIDQGSEFTVTLPIVGAAGIPFPARQPATTSAPAAGGQRRRILVVDDNADAAESLALLLSMHGHEVRTAGTAAAGMKLVEQFHPEVLLLDIGLPDRNGYEVARELRSLPATRHLKIIAITGWGQAADRAASKSSGIDAHFVKPLEAAELLAYLAGGDAIAR